MSVAGRSGLMVMTTIIVAGLVVGAGFVLALQTQNRIYRIGVDEARLKAQLHQISNRQRVESLAQEQVFNQVETMALVQPGLAAEAPRETAAAVASATPAPVRLRDESASGKPLGKLAGRKSEAGKKVPRGNRQLRQVATSGGAAKLRRQVVRTTTRGSAAAKPVKAPARRGETRRQR